MLGQCTNHDSKPASERLLNKLQNLWTLKNFFRLYWNYFVSFWLFAFRDSLLFSTSSSVSDITKYPTIKQDDDEIAPQDKNWPLSWCMIVLFSRGFVRIKTSFLCRKLIVKAMDYVLFREHKL